MSKKKRSEKNAVDSYNNNPFKRLKGFAGSEPDEALTPSPIHDSSTSVEKDRSFAEEMDFLGVDPLEDREGCPVVSAQQPSARQEDTAAVQSDEDLFLESLGQLDVRFSDSIPPKTQVATPRRLRQLKQGKLIPDANLDLHGLQRHQVPEKIDFFLQNASHHQWQTLLIVTGRGLHSADGEPVLRDAAEKCLATDGRSLIAEWGRAPRQFGGEGALVVFLKKPTQENV